MKKRKNYKPTIDDMEGGLCIDHRVFGDSDYPDTIFSRKDKKDLWTEVAKTELIKGWEEEENLQNFIIDLDRLCYRMERALDLNKTSFPDDKKRILTRLKNIIKELKDLDENPYLFRYLLGISPDMLLDKWKSDEKVKQRIALWRPEVPLNISEIIGHLKKLESEIKAAQFFTSIKNIDPFNFASTIAAFYVAYFEKKPAKTKNGTFYNIVLICYKAVGLRNEGRVGEEKVVDVYNHVKAAVDGLRWSYRKFHRTAP
jgi:hypothetical protein